MNDVEIFRKQAIEQIGDIIMEVVVGSTVHGTNVSDGLEDLDIMAVAIENRDNILGFNPKDTLVKRSKPEGVRSEAGDVDYVCYGLRKFLNLALKGNPTILTAMFTPQNHINFLSGFGAHLRTLIPHIVSRKVYMPFKGYMTQQLERLLGLRGQKNVTRPELVDKYGYDTKYASHIVRLGYQGEEILTTGKITLPMPEVQRTEIVKIRNGGYKLHEVSEMIQEAEKKLDNSYKHSSLPDNPNWNKVGQWMTETYLNSFVEKSK